MLEKKSRSIFSWIGYFFLGLDRHGWAVLNNFKLFGARDLSLKKASAFVSSVELEETDSLTLTREQIIPFAEQIVYRTIECSKCLSDGKCEHCTCEFPSKMQTPDQSCPNGEWREIMEPEAWEEYKKTQDNFYFDIKYN